MMVLTRAVEYIQITAFKMLTAISAPMTYALLLFLLSTAATNSYAQNSGSASPVTSESVSNEIIDKELTVKTGDTLQSISIDEFQTAGLWRHIAEYNRLDPTRQLTVGQLIRIPSIKSKPREYAEIVYAHGEANYISGRSGEIEALTKQTRIFVNDVIETGKGGFASIVFRTGTVINLQPNSRAQLLILSCLKSDDTCFIELESGTGSFSSNVNSTTQKTDFKVKTPHATAAVRGTVFDFDSKGGSMIVGVTQGTIDVNAGNQSLALPIGFGANAVADQPLGKPIELLPPPTYSSITPRLAENDRLGCWRIPEASSYQWVITADKNGSEVVSRQNTKESHFIMGALPAGNYYVSTRAVDDIGLKGFATTEKITIAAIDPSLVQPKLGVTRKNDVLRIHVIDHDESLGYEIQLSSNSEFIDPVSIDVGSSGRANFASPENVTYIRARALVNPKLVSAFGKVTVAD